MGHRKDDRHYMASVKLGPKGQIVIPKEARAFFGIRPGDTLLILGSEDSGLVVSKPEVLDRVAQEILGNLEE